MRTLVVIVVLAAVPALGLAQPSYRVVRITPDDSPNAMEVSVAINPTRPDNVVAVSLKTTEQGTDFAYASFDGGVTWTTVPGPNPDGRTQGDDAIVFGDDGRAYWSYLGYTGLRLERPENAASGIFVNHSDDGGLSWSEPVTVVDHLNTVEPFEDKPWLAAGPDGTVYVAWTRFSKYGSPDPDETSHIFFSRSDDGGESFAMPFRISDQAGDAIDSDGTLEGVVPAVGVDGAVYLVWSGPRGLELAASTDGGWTFSADRVISPHPGGWDMSVDGLMRANGMPVTGADHSRGPHRGAVYVNWVDDRNGDPDVFVMRSDDGGASWTTPVRVNPDVVGNGAVQFFSWMAIDPIDGSVNVAFYDRAGLEPPLTTVTLARSTDGGETFETHAVAPEPFETTTDAFFGDYLGIDAHDGRVVVAFQHFTGSSTVALSAALFQFN